MTPRHATETQRAYVERVLRTDGRLATYDALYNLAYDDGRKCSITRLAAIIHGLRHDGWQIATEDEHAALATYAFAGYGARPVAPSPTRPAVPLPEWATGWRCADCGSRPASQPAALLGDLGRAYCSTCGAQRHFRRAAA